MDFLSDTSQEEKCAFVDGDTSYYDNISEPDCDDLDEWSTGQDCGVIWDNDWW